MAGRERRFDEMDWSARLERIKMDLPEILQELQKIESDQRIKAICEGRKERQIIEERKLMALRKAINILAKS